MSGCRIAVALLAVALAPALAGAQSAEPLVSAPLPTPKPAPAMASELSGNGGTAAAEAAAVAAERQPSTLFANPSLAAELEAFLAGGGAAPSATETAPAPESAASGSDIGGAPADPVAEVASDPAADPLSAGSEIGGAVAGPGSETPAGPALPPNGGDAEGEALAMAPPPVSAGEMPIPQPVQPSLVWDDGPLDAAEAARLFEIACLATLPEFAGVGAFFDSLGFITVPGMRIRNHPTKQVSALATTPADVMESGVRSCAILVDGLEQAEAASAVEALVAERFGPARRFETPARGIAHVVWVVDTAIGPAKISVTQSGGSSFIGATVLPPGSEAQPAAGAQTDGS